MSITEAVSLALKGRGPKAPQRTGWDSLSHAERNVIALVREGLSNKEIATRLFVSPRTVESHLFHVFVKLGIRSRAQLSLGAQPPG